MKVLPKPDHVRKLKAQSGNAMLLFFEDGCYEAFNEDADRAASVLDKKTHCYGGMRSCLQFHESDLDRYLAKLGVAGCRVAMVGKVKGEEIVHNVPATANDGEAG